LSVRVGLIINIKDILPIIHHPGKLGEDENVSYTGSGFIRTVPTREDKAKGGEK